MMRNRSLAALGMTAFLATAPRAHAQCTPAGPASPAAVKGAMVGIVMDTAHRALEGVDVLIREPRRNVKTDVRGRFVITDLLPGENEITVRKLGYEIAVQTISVTDSGGVARFCLVPEPRVLPVMITSAKRTGLSGVIGDSTYTVMSGAEVRIVGQGERVLSDSAGGFYIPLRKGTYVVQVKKEGFGAQTLSVTVPADSGRQIAVWLSSPPRDANRQAAVLDDLRVRLMMATKFRANLFSSEDLGKFGGSLLQIATIGMGLAPLDPACEAIIDGGPWTLPIALIDKNEVATMEFYLPKAPRRGPTSINRNGTSTQRPSAPISSGANCGQVYIWLKP